MVGLKTFWITLFALLSLASCVPQAKKSECGSNEAFNTTLRACMPVVQGPSAFIDITAVSPTIPYIKFRHLTGSAAVMPFTITVSNPYVQPYFIRWTHNYNGTETTLKCVASTTANANAQTLNVSLYRTSIGTNLLTADIVDSCSNSMAHDSHIFQFIISETPKPTINAIEPAEYTQEIPPLLSSLTNFKVTIANNQSPSLISYDVHWQLFRTTGGAVSMGLVGLNDEDQDFSNTTLSGVHTSEIDFDPSLVGVGSYYLKARIVFDSGSGDTIIDEKVWNITVKYPPSSMVNTISLIQGNSLAYNTPVAAYSGVAYPDFPIYNYVPTIGSTAQSDFCVRFNDGDGSISGDGQFISVEYYLNGIGAPIYVGSTDDMGKNEVCLSEDATALLQLKFTNASPTSSVDHKLIAKIRDVVSNREYVLSDLVYGTYPIEWNINVRPQNQAPTIQFGATSAGITGCSTNLTGTRTGCTVLSDTNFTVSAILKTDDFDIAATSYTYTFQLYKNSVAVAGKTCTATDGSAPPRINDLYTCVMSIDSYESTGAIDVGPPAAYTIQATVVDSNSPILPPPAVNNEETSNVLTWNLTVTETNTAHYLQAATTVTNNSPVAEGTGLIMTAVLEDLERDNFDWSIEYAASGAIASTPAVGVLASNTITKTTNALAYTLTRTQILPEDFLLNPALGCANTARGGACNVAFRYVITDKTFTATPLPLKTAWTNISIINTNDAPDIFDTLANPNRATFTSKVAFVGVPLTINATPSGTVTDGSSAAAEGSAVHRFQWYAQNTASATWTAISGATGSLLNWTPSLIDSGSTVSLALCVEDQSVAIVAIPAPTISTCNTATPWVVTVRNNHAFAHIEQLASSTAAGQNGTETAIWYDSPSTYNGVSSSAAYVAMLTNTNIIKVKKVLVQNDGQIVAGPGSRVVFINPFPAGAAGKIEDLSITGTADSLYIAYNASTAAVPNTFYPQVRRLDISSGKVVNIANTNQTFHQGKLGFDYNGIAITNSCAPAGECVITNPADGSAPRVRFQPAATITGNITITTPQGTLVIPFAPPPVSDNAICSNCAGSQMATDFAAAINADNAGLSGISATAVGDTVTITGSLALDYYDGQTAAVSRSSDQMGSIYVSGGKWFVPFINNSLGGAANDKISFLSGDIDLNLGTGSGIATLAEPIAPSNLAAMVSTSKFVNQLVGGDLFLGVIDKSGGGGLLYKINPTSFGILSQTTIFGTNGLTDIQLDASSTYVYVGASLTTGPENWLAIYDNVGLANRDEFKMDDVANVDVLSTNIFKKSSVSSYKIVAYGTEARILAASNADVGTSYHLYLGRLYDDAGTWKLTCNDCEKVSSVEMEVGQYVKISAAPIRMKVAGDALYRLGSDGFTLNEGIKDVLFTSYGEFPPATPADVFPRVGIFNMQAEQISSTFIGPLIGTEADDGYFRPPFIKN